MLQKEFKNRTKIDKNYFNNIDIREICDNLNIDYTKLNFYIINNDDLLGFCHYNNIHINEDIIYDYSRKPYKNKIKGILTHELIHYKNNDSNYIILLILDLTIFISGLCLLFSYNMLTLIVLLLGLIIINIIIRMREFRTEKETIKEMNFDKDYINLCYRRTFVDKNILSYLLSNRPFRSDLDDFLDKKE